MIVACAVNCQVRPWFILPTYSLWVGTCICWCRDMASETIPAVSSLDMQLLVDDGLQEGVTGTGFGGMHIHRTSSGSSLGSEGGPAGGTINGFNQNYQG